MQAKTVLLAWIDKFNEGDAKGLAELYHEDAINHQVVSEPVIGKANI